MVEVCSQVQEGSDSIDLANLEQSYILTCRQRMHGFMISLFTTGREACTALHVAYHDYVHGHLVQRKPRLARFAMC